MSAHNSPDPTLVSAISHVDAKEGMVARLLPSGEVMAGIVQDDGSLDERTLGRADFLQGAERFGWRSPDSE